MEAARAKEVEAPLVQERKTAKLQRFLLAAVETGLIVFSRDGTILASAGEDNTLILWNLPRILNLDVLAYGYDRVRDYLRTNQEVQQRDTPNGTGDHLK